MKISDEVAKLNQAMRCLDAVEEDVKKLVWRDKEEFLIDLHQAQKYVGHARRCIDDFGRWTSSGRKD